MNSPGGFLRIQRELDAEREAHNRKLYIFKTLMTYRVNQEYCMEVTGHATPAMFMRYADLFSDEEKQARQREVQARIQEWKE